MITNPRAGRGAHRVVLLCGFAFLLAACVADGQQSGGAEEVVATKQPRHATYNCGEDGAISVENRSSSVRLVEAEGDSYELPASPPTQTSRYGEGGLALVVEGREALWMKAGSEPLTCVR